ncbi:MAG: hypothetical protein A2W25_11330 [candidate division Zixibacteria bacterium RBG_16_53_22]|nr:MAG: hypothetical protein A2W25_11330 [candidate division Zixibacteria bacterium RBG_16_53_22]
MRLISGILAALILFSTAYAGSVDPALELKIADADPQTLFPTLIFMADQVDVMVMKHQQDLAQATRAERHYEVVTALQRMATDTQADILNYLAQAKSRQTVGEYRGFWIANMIWAELTSAEISALAARPDVATVYSDFEGELIKPIFDYSDPEPVITRVENGLRAIRADSMWARGYTGVGRLVMNIDTGVSGSHPALTQRWRGNNGHPWQESWLDTSDPSSDFPFDDPADAHGTHTMGTICGRSTTTQDTIGVAIDAQWIAARAVDITGGNIAAAFEWGADPDGNPNTVEDVPDVISNSWGSIPQSGDECPPNFYTLIDNCEAAGAVVLFAAGNEGTAGLRIPANRITTPYNCFSIGAIDGNNASFPIAYFSSRGPSQCDNLTIKPEVVAPGVNVRSSVPGGAYESGWSGTSMSCPHVAGAVALLRQVNPNASVDTIKWALINSARDLPLNNPNGEENTFGWGIIDVNAASRIMPAIDAPYIISNAMYIIEPDNGVPDPGETISAYVRLRNGGLPATNVAAILSTVSPFATVTQDSAYYGAIAQDDTALSATPFTIAIGSSAPIGAEIAFDLNITADSGYQASRGLIIQVGNNAQPEIATHNIGNVDYTVSNFGRYGLPPDGIDPGQWQGRGFRMPRTGANNLFEGALLIGDGPTRVSDGARDDNQAPQADFEPIDTIAQYEPGPYAEEEFHTSFNDMGADAPLFVQVTQKTFAFSQAPDNDYVITEYSIRNIGTDSLTGFLVAHWEDWDIPYGSPTDRANFDRARNLGYQYSSSTYRGQQVLTALGVYSFKALQNDGEVYPPHMTTADKWTYMNAGTTDTAITTAMDASMMITTGPYNLAPGEAAVAAFAILGGTSLVDLRANADAAIVRYAQLSVDEDAPVTMPRNFSLVESFPNPFNARVTIRFNLVDESFVRLETYDLLGRKVATLIDRELGAGTHSIVWDCAGLPSGVYFYRLSDNDKSVAGKMTLLK